MKGMLEDIPDDDMRKKLQGYSENPDDSAWDNIASGLRESMPLRERLQSYIDQPDEVLWPSIRTGVVIERSLLWLERTGFVVTIISLLMIGYPFLFNDVKPNNIAHQTAVVDHKANNNKPQDNKGELTEVPRPGENRKRSENAEHSKSQQQIIDRVNEQEQNITGPSGAEKSKDNVRAAGMSLQKDAIDVNKNNLGQDVNSVQVTNSTFEQDNSTEGEDKKSAQNLNAKSDNDHALAADTDSASVERVIVEKKEQEQQQTLLKPEQKEKSKKKKHGGIYVLLMPTFGYQHIAPVKDDNILIESIEKVSAFSTKRLGIRGEIGIEKFLSRKFSYHVGVLYYQRKQTINYMFKDRTSARVEKTSSQDYLYQVTVPTDSGTFEYELKNIGLLVGLNYTTKIRKFVHKVGIAGELHQGLNQVNRETDAGQRYFAFGDLYYRLSYPVSRRIDIMFQPTLNYALQMDSRVNAPFYVKPYGLGLNFGAYFHF
jgi:hypothetical protein